jgi:hypothetical protein
MTEVKVLSCTNCGRTLRNTAYELRTGDRRSPHCLRCALRYRPMLKRSLVVCVVVGTMLTAINQGNFILAGDFQAAMAWKIPMTYTVPFIVASAGSLMNAKAHVVSLVKAATD